MGTINPRAFYTFRGQIILYYPKLFECTICILNYDPCYTVHPDVSFTVKLDENMKHVTCTCVLLKWHKLKRPKSPLFPIIYKPFSFSFFLLFLFSDFSQMRISPFLQIIILAILKSPNQNHPWHHHCSTTVIPGSTSNDDREIQLKSIVHNPFINTLKIEFKCPCYTLQEHQLQITFMKVNVIYLFYFTDWSL